MVCLDFKPGGAGKLAQESRRRQNHGALAAVTVLIYFVRGGRNIAVQLTTCFTGLY